MTTSTQISRVKKAELLSSIGAGVLGAGIALLLANQLASYAIPILLLGLLSHAAGMFQKHGLEQQGEVRSRLVGRSFVLVLLAGLGSVVTFHHRPPILK